MTTFQREAGHSIMEKHV